MSKTISLAVRLMALAAVLAVGCTSTGSRDGMVYRDGSWYSPAGDGRGDYYTGSPRYEEGWDYGTGFGVGIVPFGGYCPVRYRYCTSFWPDPFYYGPIYDPFYDPLIVYYRAPRPHRAPPPRHPLTGVEPGEDSPLPPPPRDALPSPQPRPWDERAQPRRSGAGDGTRTRRREGNIGGGPG